MLKKSVVEHTLEAALETGADFAELYVEQTKRNHIAMVNGQVETALGGLDYGAGIRLFCGNRVIYAFVNDTSEENLVRTAREMASTVKGDTPAPSAGLENASVAEHQHHFCTAGRCGKTEKSGLSGGGVSGGFCL